MDPSSRSRLRKFVLSACAALALASTATACTSSAVRRIGTGNQLFGLQAQYEAVVRDVLPSVVQINAGDSTGSGVVYDDKGDIVTNAHVVGSAKTVQVREAMGTTSLTANVIGAFPPDDLAVIRVTKDAGGLKPARFGGSNDTQIGEIVLAMGNPLGLTDSVTQGIISATGRTVGAPEPGGQALITAAIQTSAAINPGNSGGALVNLESQVVGVPTLAARLPDQGGAAPGIGFAIPSATVQNIADQLIKSGKVTNSDRATLDVTAQTATNQEGKPAGVAVLAVTDGGAASKAGIRAGDVIVGINDLGISSLQELESALTQFKPGDKVTVHYTRNGADRTTTAKLGSLGS
ncbi:MAG: S1C family serine protease [Streptosporangiaceae bacterium]